MALIKSCLKAAASLFSSITGNGGDTNTASYTATVDGLVVVWSAKVAPADTTITLNGSNISTTVPSTTIPMNHSNGCAFFFYVEAGDVVSVSAASGYYTTLLAIT